MPSRGFCEKKANIVENAFVGDEFAPTALTPSMSAQITGEERIAPLGAIRGQTRITTAMLAQTVH